MMLRQWFSTACNSCLKVIINEPYTFKNAFQKKRLCTVMKFEVHKQKLSKFCHLLDFNMNATGDS
jgi:hypothetical protein